MESSYFLWNLYSVVVSNHKNKIMVCAPSINGAIKRVNSLIRSWDTSESHSILSVTFVSPCLN